MARNKRGIAVYTSPMTLGKYLRSAIVNTVRNVSIFFRDVPIEEPIAPKRAYDPKRYANFYIVARGIVQSLLDNPSAKTARLFSEETGYAQSTIRTVCKLLAAEGILVRTQEFPAAYGLVSTNVGVVKLASLNPPLPAACLNCGHEHLAPYWCPVCGAT
jgi:hypothetical protein